VFDMQAALVRRLLAEVVGTALLVLFGAGSVVAALTAGRGQLPYAGLGFVSLAFGLVIAVVIYAFGPVSGAHLNPSVTLSLAITRRFPWAEVGPYILAQLVGAFVGALLIVAAFGRSAVDLGVGSTSLAPGVSYWQGIVAEVIGTFLLMFAVMALAVDARAPLGWAGLMIGLAIATAILLIGPVTGGALNPARAFGPYLVLTVFGGTVSWSQYPVFVIGPIIGAVCAALLYDFIAETRAAEVAATEEAYTPNPGEAA
jgi:glycerol uptake facilitator protein